MSGDSESFNHKKSKIAFFGLFGVGNLGNDMTLQAMLHHCQERQPKTELLCITSSPEVAADMFGISSIHMGPIYGPDEFSGGRLRKIVYRISRRLPKELKQFFDTTRYLKNVDRIIIPGTGALDDFGVSPTWVPYLLFHWCAIARILRVRVDFVSVGAGPIEHPLSRVFMLQALHLATYRSFRDTISKDYLQSVGFKCAADPVYPDLAFSLPPEFTEINKPPESPPTTIGIGVMGYYGWSNDPEKGETIYQQYLLKIRQFVIWLLEQGYFVRLIIGEMPTDQRPVDDLLAYVEENNEYLSGYISADPIESANDIFRALLSTDLVVATRFHNVICSLLLDRPVISIGYAPKNEALLDELGLVGYSQHIDSFEINELQNQLLSLAAEHIAAIRRVQQAKRLYRTQLERQYDILLGRSIKPSDS